MLLDCTYFEELRFELEGDLIFARTASCTDAGHAREISQRPRLRGCRTSHHYGDDVRAAVRPLERPGSSRRARKSSRAWRCSRAPRYVPRRCLRRNEGEPGKRNMDGFQAHLGNRANARRRTSPKPRYAHAGYDGTRRTMMKSPRWTEPALREAARHVHRAASEVAVLRLDVAVTSHGNGQRHRSRRIAAAGSIHGRPLPPLTMRFKERGDAGLCRRRAGESSSCISACPTCAGCRRSRSMLRKPPSNLRASRVRTATAACSVTSPRLWGEVDAKRPGEGDFHELFR